MCPMCVKAEYRRYIVHILMMNYIWIWMVVNLYMESFSCLNSRLCLQQCYSCHFCWGAMTSAAVASYSDNEIQQLRCWCSDVYRLYIDLLRTISFIFPHISIGLRMSLTLSLSSLQWLELGLPSHAREQWRRELDDSSVHAAHVSMSSFFTLPKSCVNRPIILGNCANTVFTNRYGFTSPTIVPPTMRSTFAAIVCEGEKL